MAKVTGFGGIFFKSKDPKALRDWYTKHLGLRCDDYGTSFRWKNADNPSGQGYTVWSPFKEDTDYFAPSTASFMMNFRVDDLKEMLAELAAAGIEKIGELQEFDYGLFAHILDPEGNKIELWQPNDDVYGSMIEGATPE